MQNRRVSAGTAVFVAFSLAYLAFFIWPQYRGQVIAFYPPVTIIGPSIGGDLGLLIDSVHSLLNGGSPYEGYHNWFPPLTYALAIPLAMAGRDAAFVVVTTLTLLGFLWTTLVLPRLGGRGGITALHAVIVVTGLLSYGLRFELERGQFNVIAMTCGLTGVWLFHHRPDRRLLAYALVTLAIQLKVYPAILLLMLVDDWRDWRAIAKRWSALAAANLGLLLVLGPGILWGYIRITGRIVLTSTGWPGDHSSRGFATLPGLFPGTLLGLPWSRIAEFAFDGAVAICIGVLVLNAYRRNRTGLNRELLAACILGGMVLPQMSHDYKLSILPAAMAFLFVNDAEEWRGDWISAGLLFVLASAFAATLFPMEARPEPLRNSFPMLATMLAALAIAGFRLQTADQSKI